MSERTSRHHFLITHLSDFGMEADPPVPYDVQRRMSGLTVETEGVIETRNPYRSDVLLSSRIIVKPESIAVASLLRGDGRTADFFARYIAQHNVHDVKVSDFIIDKRAGRPIEFEE